MLKRQLVSDGFWVAIAQLASALGALATVRVLTEILTPDQFGILALALGAITFAQALFCTPSLQALLRYYPDFKIRGRAADLCETTKRIILRQTLYLIAFGMTTSVLGYQAFAVPLLTIVLISMFLLIEMWRSYEITLFNPNRMQKQFAAVMTLDAVLRAPLAWIFVHITGFGVEAVLLAFIFASTLTATIAQISFPKGGGHSDSRNESLWLERQIRTFSLPILPLAVIVWSYGTLDRYVIAGMLGSGQAGIYAAAYGLVSRPLVMTAQVLEQTIRPAYYEAVSRNDREASSKYFQLWVGLAIVTAMGGFLCVLIFSDLIAGLFLGERFRQAAYIMPWIALAYGIVGVVQALEMRFYAHLKTRQILAVELTGIVAMLTTLPFLIQSAGLLGAAIALCVGTFGQLIIVLFVFSFSDRPEEDLNLINAAIPHVTESGSPT
jgi:O-antigen/teichoic acid export membrane protein